MVLIMIDQDDVRSGGAVVVPVILSTSCKDPTSGSRLRFLLRPVSRQSSLSPAFSLCFDWTTRTHIRTTLRSPLIRISDHVLRISTPHHSTSHLSKPSPNPHSALPHDSARIHGIIFCPSTFFLIIIVIAKSPTSAFHPPNSPQTNDNNATSLLQVDESSLLLLSYLYPSSPHTNTTRLQAEICIDPDIRISIFITFTQYRS